MSSFSTPMRLTAAARIWEVAYVSEPPNSRAETRTQSSAPMAISSRSMPAAGGGPMVTTVTRQPVSSFSCRAASTAFMSSGLMMVCMDARSSVPSGFTATFPEVSGTCFTQTIIFILPLPPCLFHAQMAGDNHTLNLGSALVDLGDLRVAHHALHGILTGVAISAEQLDSTTSHIGSGLSSKQLCHCGSLGIVLMQLLLASSGIHQHLSSLHAGVHVSQLELG